MKMMALIITALLLLFSAPAYATDVTLNWDRPADSRVVGYTVYYWLYGQRDVSTEIGINDPATTSQLITDLQEGRTYEFAARSVADNGNMSDWSEVIDYAVPVYIPICPANMRVVVSIEPIE